MNDTNNTQVKTTIPYSINWFPGHMAKTMRQIRDRIGVIDLVIEVLDSRAPFSSINHSLKEVIKDRPTIFVMNKSDMSDPIQNEIFLKELNKINPTIILDSLNGSNNISLIEKKIDEVLKVKIDKEKEKGRSIYPVKAIVVGIPNSGKSTLMNNLAKRKAMVTGDRPGVTKNQQFLKVSNKLLLLDNPGILWPKFENQEQAKTLALIGSIKDEIVPTNITVSFGIEKIKELYPSELKARYKLDTLDKDTDKIIEDIAIKRGCIKKGGIIDIERAYDIILKDIRSAKIGRMTFERLS